MTTVTPTSNMATFSSLSNGTTVFDNIMDRKKKGVPNNVTAEDLESYKIADVVNLYIPPIIIVAGVVCNILSIVVMRSRHFQNISTSIYMIACAANDASSLCISLTAHWLYVNYPEAIVRNEHSHIMCKFFNFYGWGNCDYTISLTAAMTADRAYAIMYPLKSSCMNLTRKAKIAAFALVLVVAAKEFHFLLSSDMVPATRRDRMCDVVPISSQYQYFYDEIWPWIHIVFLVVCFITIIGSNAIIVWNVRQSASGLAFKNVGERERTYSETSINNPSRSKLRQITKMLLAQSTALILLTFPFSFHLAISAQIPDLYTDPVKKAANQLGFSIVFYLLYSNKIVNFTIYCISGERFRLALREMFCGRHDQRRHSAVAMMIKPVISASQTTISTITSFSPPPNTHVSIDPNG